MLTTAAAKFETMVVRPDDMAWLAQAEDRLRRMRLSFFCPRCQAAGMPDGVAGSNSYDATKWSVACGCTQRIGAGAVSNGSRVSLS